MAKPNGRCDQAMSALRHARIVQVGCAARSLRRLMALATGCTLVATSGTAADSGQVQVEELLSEATHASSDGDFETSWTSHRRAWEIAAGSPEAGDAMLAYCERHDCPNIHKTGWLLANPDSDLALLADTCRGRDNDACRRWFNGLHRLRAHLGPDRRAPRQRPQEVPMRFPHVEAGHLAP